MEKVHEQMVKQLIEEYYGDELKRVEGIYAEEFLQAIKFISKPTSNDDKLVIWSFVKASYLEEITIENVIAELQQIKQNIGYPEEDEESMRSILMKSLNTWLILTYHFAGKGSSISIIDLWKFYKEWINR